MLPRARRADPVNEPVTDLDFAVGHGGSADRMNRRPDQKKIAAGRRVHQRLAQTEQHVSRKRLAAGGATVECGDGCPRGIDRVLRAGGGRGRRLR
jgi:hypothetical protein